MKKIFGFKCIKRIMTVSLAAMLTLGQMEIQPISAKEISHKNMVLPNVSKWKSVPGSQVPFLGMPDYELHIDAAKTENEISDMLYGAFIEDINYAADGGLYAEMVKNRSFEYGDLATNGSRHGWSLVGTVTAEVKDKDSLNENNTQYMEIKNSTNELGGIENYGFLDGMSIKKDSNYQFSVWAKGVDGYTGEVTINLMAGESIAAAATIPAVTKEWKQYELTLKSNQSAGEIIIGKEDQTKEVSLKVIIEKGAIDLDMVSLFPEDTYKNRKNGLRKDLAELIADMSPKFLRFPGGCVIEGNTIDKAYCWKDSIGCNRDGQPMEFHGTYGDIAARRQGEDIWAEEGRATEHPYYMTYGLGFYEYFQFAEDIKAIGVPVVNCGMRCQGQGTGSDIAIDSKEFQRYIQDALDLVEFCRGDKTTTWGKIRIAMGHQEPFQLKYIGIGNEQWGTSYFERYEKFKEAFLKKAKENPKMYGDIELIVANGPAFTDKYAWNAISSSKEGKNYAGLVDEHYYMSPESFFQNHEHYDSYDRESVPVFLGEYAAQSNNLLAALAEASYMTGLERNGDIVKLAAYAPLFGNTTQTQWAPDLIWFNNTKSWGSINYYVQKMFANHTGTKVISSKLAGNHSNNQISENLKGRVGIGTWSTVAEFDNFQVINNATGEIFSADDFSKNTISNWDIQDGNWFIQDGKMHQTSSNTDIASPTGTVAYFGDLDWENYTITVEAKKISGSEGFLIPFAVKDANKNMFWNYGGWNNTRSTIQESIDGVRTEIITGKSAKVITDHTYQLKVVVTHNSVKCYVDGVLNVSYHPVISRDIYHVVSTDDTGDIIVKLVNTTDSEKTISTNLYHTQKIEPQAEVYQIFGMDLKGNNTLKEPEKYIIKESKIDVSEKFDFTVPAYSINVVRIHAKAEQASNFDVLSTVDDTITEKIDTDNILNNILVEEDGKAVSYLYVNGTTKTTCTIPYQLPKGYTGINAQATGVAGEVAFSYTSLNPSIATVDKSGKVTAKKAGNTYIAVNAKTVDINAMTYLYQIRVLKPSLKLKKTKAITVGKNTTITAKVKGYQARDLKWSSSSSKILSIKPNKGKKTVVIKGLKTGTATITVKAGKKIAKMKVTIKGKK